MATRTVISQKENAAAPDQTSRKNYWDAQHQDTQNSVESDHWLYLLRHKPTGRVLNVGCGKSRGNWYLCESADMYVGADISNVSLTDAKRSDKRASKFVCCDALQLPFKDNSFDYVLSFVTIPTLGTSAPTAIREMIRVSRENVVFDLVASAGLEKNDAYRITQRSDGYVLADNIGCNLSIIGFDDATVRPMLEDMGLRVETLEVLTIHQLNYMGRPAYEWVPPPLFPEENTNQLIYIEAKKKFQDRAIQ